MIQMTLTVKNTNNSGTFNIKGTSAGAFNVINYLPNQETGVFLWLRGDLGVTYNPSTFKVSAWANQGSAGGSFSQVTTTKQPTYNATGIAGWPSLSWSGGSIQTALINNSITNAASNYTFFFACNPNATQSSTGIWLLDVTTGRLIFTQASLSSPNGRVAYFDGTAYRGNVNGTTGAQILTFELISTASSTIYRNGSSLATSLAYGTQRAIGGAIGLGSSNAGSAGWFEGDLFEIIGVNTTNTAMRNRIHSYLGARYGITTV